MSKRYFCGECEITVDLEMGCETHPLAPVDWEPDVSEFTAEEAPEEAGPESIIDLDQPISFHLSEVAKQVEVLARKLQTVQDLARQADNALASWENLPKEKGGAYFSHWISDARAHLTKALETL